MSVKAFAANALIMADSSADESPHGDAAEIDAFLWEYYENHHHNPVNSAALVKVAEGEDSVDEVDDIEEETDEVTDVLPPTPPATPSPDKEPPSGARAEPTSPVALASQGLIPRMPRAVEGAVVAPVVTVTAEKGLIPRRPMVLPEVLLPAEGLYRRCFEQLNAFQKGILRECQERHFGGLACPVGSGKTVISLCLALHYSRRNGGMPILVVVAKSLVASWEAEIRKFLGTDLRYVVFHQEYCRLAEWRLTPDIQMVLTTADVMAKFYKECAVQGHFITQRFVSIRAQAGAYINDFNHPVQPFINYPIGGGTLFSRVWSCLVIDEAQKYTNIDTLRCQALGAVCAKARWLLSGTLFDEPKDERILGYHVMLDAPGMPRNLPDTQRLIRSDAFQGLNQHLVYRAQNDAFTPPLVEEEIVTHVLSDPEQKVYTTMRNILKEVNAKAEQARHVANTDEQRRFSGARMVMIMYLRQAVVCPLIPITSVAIDASDMKDRSDVAVIVMQEIHKLGIEAWLNDPRAYRSSRLVANLRTVARHPDERVICFACFISYLDLLEHCLREDYPQRPVFKMTSEMSAERRGQLIEQFRAAPNGVLLLSYQIGATGLNLQFAATVLLVDFWWNAAQTQQAIGRIFRFGQQAPKVRVYFFSANTGIEKILFAKQGAKLSLLEELRTGQARTKVPRINMREIVQMIELEDNVKGLRRIRHY